MARKPEDLTGQRFGRLTALHLVEGVRPAKWVCACDCGKEIEVRACHLKSGNTRSCGCIRDERTGAMGRANKKAKEPKAARRKRKSSHAYPEDMAADNGTGVRGVYKGSKGRKYDAKINVGDSLVYLGSFDTVEEAARARRDAEWEYFPDQCKGKRPRRKIKPGETFGKLTVVAETENRDGAGSIVWRCRCECGNVVDVSGNSLRRGGTRSCGCIRRGPKAIDLTGQRFGRLVVVGRSGSRPGGGAVWDCRCDCGNTVCVTGGNLRSGSTASCGCARSGSVSAGDRFGSLLVERYNSETGGWDCRCDCGKPANFTGSQLTSGQVTSCGCGITKLARIDESSGRVDGTKLSHLSSKPSKASETGVRGVSWNKRRGKYEASIYVQGKPRKLGFFETLEEAAEARREAEEELFDPILEEHGWEPTSEDAYQEALRKAKEKGR